MAKFPILVWYKIPRWKIFLSVKGYFLFFANFVLFRTLQNSSNHASKLNLHVNIILILSKHQMDFLYSVNLFRNKWERLCTKTPNLAHFGTFLKGFFPVPKLPVGTVRVSSETVLKLDFSLCSWGADPQGTPY